MRQLWTELCKRCKTNASRTAKRTICGKRERIFSAGASEKGPTADEPNAPANANAPANSNASANANAANAYENAGIYERR